MIKLKGYAFYHRGFSNKTSTEKKRVEGWLLKFDRFAEILFLGCDSAALFA